MRKNNVDIIILRTSLGIHGLPAPFQDFLSFYSIVVLLLACFALGESTRPRRTLENKNSFFFLCQQDGVQKAVSGLALG